MPDRAQNDTNSQQASGQEPVGDNDATTRKPPLWRSLSAKVLALTVLFILLGEVLIFLPSIANFRITWLRNRIAMAEVAALAVEAAPQRQVSDDLRAQLLRGAGVRVVALKRGGSRHLVLRDDAPVMAEARFDLREIHWWQTILEAFGALASGGKRTIAVVDTPPNMTGDFIELVLDEKPMFKAMVNYSLNILKLSIVLSFIVAALVFLALNWLLIRPIRYMSANMVRFGEDPEDAQRIIKPSRRRDELGVAEHQLAHMQEQTASLLQQKNRLAALGLAVSKISHELRNMLASAQMISDRLAMVEDPTVKKFAPKLIASLDRAIAFCVGTLKYGRAHEAPPRRRRLRLRMLVEEVFEGTPAVDEGAIVLRNNVPEDLEADADPDQLFRILANMTGNAHQALMTTMRQRGRPGEIAITAWREGAVVTIQVADNGPGLPKQAREHLFEAFRGSARRGGTGLGLSIARELARAHGGDIALVSGEATGAIFQITIPDRVVNLEHARDRSSQKAG